MDRSWTPDVRNIAQRLNRAIRKQDFIQAKILIDQLINQRRNGVNPNLRQDAAIVIDHIIQKYGKEQPTDFLSEDWQGDFKGIRKRLVILFQTRNLGELKKLLERMNTVATTNADSSVRIQALNILAEIAKYNVKLVDLYEQKYLRVFLDEKNLSIQKLVNELLVQIDPAEYYGNYEQTLEKLNRREKKVNITVRYDFHNDFLRYKVQVLNNTEEILWDVNYQINKYENNLIIRQIYPDFYEVYENNVIYLSILRPGEMKEIIVTVEPRSPQIYLEGMVNYKKQNENDYYAIPAQDLMVDLIACLPKFQLLEKKVGVSHIREFFDFHVKYKSSNVFALPNSISPKLAYKTGKEILEKLHTILALDVMDEDPFFGEALFYGKTDANEEIVAILRSSEENKSLEITIGTNNNTHLVAIQISFDDQLRQNLILCPEFSPHDKLIELRCPHCLSSFDKIRNWCPWCGFELDPNFLLS
ncbi:MAG: hypothetical protein JW776_06805 [Candidatus Lokiarchaeota archaeon]|nr:hypothetical protein [Candidatus Lokiarchaeota archaeon]